jgi:Rps23 Pro-64 3,4-dihydroxylase Tpa1-like proline 4-hydroxylase
MTAREMMDNLSETLMCDERILSVPERELLANLLQRTSNHVSARDNAVTEAIAHAVGEIIAQRTYAVLGQSITQRLIEQASASHSCTGAVVVHGGDPAPPKSMPRPLTDPAPPKSMPRPLSDPAPPKAMPKPLSDPAPPKAMPRPLSDPAPPKAMPRPLSDPAPPKSTPRPLSDPAPPRSTASVTQVESHGVAVMERPDFLPAQFVVLDEFLAHEELKQLMQYTLDHEPDFEVSEVVSPGASGGRIDYEHRRSRVLMNLGKHHEVIADRIQAYLPGVLQKLRCDGFRPSQIEVQITASNHGDFFRHHSDNLHEDTVSRELTFVYFFHREPKAFRGGDLRIYDSRWENGRYVSTGEYQTIVPEQNQMVIFPSSLVHEISPVDCPSEAFADSRFTVNGWFHR